MKQTSVIRICILVCALALVGSACGGGSTSSTLATTSVVPGEGEPTESTTPATTEPTSNEAGSPLTIATGIDIGYSVYYVAVDEGFLEAEGIDGEYLLFDSGPAAQEALVAGEADVSQNAELPVQRPHAEGADFYVVAESYFPTRNMCVVVSEDVQSPEDLNGQTVTYLELSGGQYLWEVWAEANSVSDVEAVSLAPPDMPPAMDNGDVQAAIIWLPWCNTIPEVVDGAHVLSWPAEEGLYSPRNSSLFHAKLVDDDPELGVRAMRAFIAAADWINENPELAAETIAPVLRLEPEEAATQLQAVMPFTWQFVEEDMSSFAAVAGWARDQGIVEFEGEPQAFADSLLNPCLMLQAAPERVTISEGTWDC